MPKIFAVKEVRYAQRRYLPGDAFDASEKDAKLLTAIGRASYGKKPNKTDLPEPKPAAERDEMAELRTEYEDKIGRRPYMGWNADMLREKMAEYLRRDMRAED